MAKQQTIQERNWYVIHTYSGYEDAVARSLKQRVESLDMEDKIFQVLVPKEKKLMKTGMMKTAMNTQALGMAIKCGSRSSGPTPFQNFVPAAMAA